MDYFSFLDYFPLKNLNKLTAWQVFGLCPLASWKVVRQQYKMLALRFHPDKQGNEEKFKCLRQAYQFLEKLQEQGKLRPHIVIELQLPTPPVEALVATIEKLKFESGPADKCQHRCQVCGRFFHTIHPRDVHQAKCTGGTPSRKGASKRK